MKYYALLLSAALLAACGDSSSNTKGPESEASYASVDDLPNCTAKREGESAYVEKDKETYVCNAGKWVEEDQQMKSFETMDDLPNCTAKRDGEVVYIKDEDEKYECVDGSWEKATGSTDPSDKDPGDGSKDKDGDSSDDGGMSNKEAQSACEDMDDADKQELADVAQETFDVMEQFFNENVNTSTESAYLKDFYKNLLKKYGGISKACPMIALGYGVTFLTSAMNNSSVKNLRHTYDDNNIDRWYGMDDDNYVARLLKTIREASYDLGQSFTYSAQVTLKNTVIPALDSAIKYIGSVAELDNYVYESESGYYVTQVDQSEFSTLLGLAYAAKGLFVAVSSVNLELDDDGEYDWIDGYLSNGNSYYGQREAVQFISKLMAGRTMFSKVNEGSENDWKSVPSILSKATAYVRKGLQHSLNDKDQMYDLYVVGDGANADFSATKVREYISRVDDIEDALSGDATIEYGDGKTVVVNVKKFFTITNGFMQYMPYMECDDVECYFTDAYGRETISLSDAKRGYAEGDEEEYFYFKDPTFGGVFPKLTQRTAWDLIRNLK